MSEDTPATPDAASEPTGDEILAWVLLSTLVGIALILGYCLQLQERSWQAIEEAAADLDRTEPGWRLSELEDARPQVLPTRNGAHRVLAATARLPRARADLPPLTLQGEPANERLRPVPERQLEDALAPLAEARAEARTLDGFETGRFPIRHGHHGLDTPLPHLQEVQSVMWLLHLDAAWHAQRGDLRGAMTSARATINAGRAIGDEPFLQSQRARMAAVRLGLEAAERALGQGEPPVDDLTRLQAILEAEARHPSFEIIVRGKRAALHLFLQFLGSREGWSRNRVHLGEAHQRHLVREDHPQMFDLLGHELDIARRPTHERPSLQQALDERIEALPQGVVKEGLSHLGNLERDERLRLAALRCAIVGLAAERYRRANRAWPGALTDLKGLVRADALVNPHTGKPLDYRRRPDGASLAAPEDAKVRADRGGLPPVFPSAGVFRLWDPAQRGRPPTPRPPPGP
jgi:hypothetical protein